MSIPAVLQGLNYDTTKARRDVVAGLTVAAVSLPQSITYALVAGVDPKFGVYSAIVVTFVAAIFGSSSHLINGPTSAISLLVFSSLAFLDPENRTVLFDALFLLGVLVGAFQILIAVFKLGDLTRYISESVIIGFLVAAALLIALGQLGNALGVKDKGTGRMPVLKRTYLTLFEGDAVNYRALVLTVTTVALAVGLRWLVKRYGLPQLDLLAVLIIAAVIAYVAGWSTANSGGNTAVALTAKISQSLPTPHIPDVQLGVLGQLSEGALAIAFIGLIEALSIAKAIAHQSGQRIDYNRQILAEGLANLTGGFFQSVPGSGSMSRSPINFQAGAASRFSGVVASAGVAVVVLLFAPLLHYMPKAALAGLLLITAARLIDYKRLFYMLKASRYDAGLVIVTALTGVLVDLDTAVLLGVALSILLFVPRAAKLKAKELIVTPERVVRERVAGDPVDPSTIIYDLEGELFFGAAPELDRYLDALRDRVKRDGISFVVLRLKRVRHPDAVVVERIEQFLREETARGVTVLLAGVQPDMWTVLKNVGLEKWFSGEHVFPEEDEEFSATLKAVRYAHAQLGIDEPREPLPAAAVSGNGDRQRYYYLV
ncbi:sulfate transporter [Mycobacterium paraense]|uniref:Sulfate transporter n=1 Tax=Mycobacterium paraense TaxID=767916 RepID=A0ABX3VK00_9MYCO|nr:SulP family inorganic anion transporter [Mycobacterium paraense]ORW30053.1 sulfate transporter [Mycobacterium paraense]ORW39898.1 sulfate transporter [Mycobacterium paraense]